MGKGRKNTFKKAIRHLKSTQIDEKLQLLNEIPTNNTAGIYVVEPEYQVQDPDVQVLPRAADFTQDALENGRDTTGLFLEDGTILTIEPPGDTSYILGPMASMWYAWGNFSTIGYIRQSDRRMVDLGRITGQLGSWNGSGGFTSYGQLTLEQAVWFRDTPKLNGANNNTPNYRAFYPGPPSNAPDQYGRYLCTITGTPKPTGYTPPPRRVPPTMGGFDPNLPPGSANPNKKKKDNEIAQLYPADYDQERAIDQMLLRGLQRGDYGTGPDIDRQIKNLQKNLQQKTPGGLPRASAGNAVVASYDPQGKLLSESRKKILRNIKKPYVLPEQPKVKYKVKPGANRSINVDLMKKAEVPSSFKRAEERMWGKYEKEQNARFSQERKNEVLDHLGGGDHAWEYMTETSRKKNDEIMYGNFGGEQKKAKVVRKEQLKGDTLLFIADENGRKESILQSELSIRLADEFNKELFEKYFQEQETIEGNKEPLFKKVSKRLKKEIDYPDKPAKNGYPNDPPPEMVNGWHPEYGEKDAYYNKVDPESAKAMPLTGNPHIDKKVKAARKKPK